jgi:putative FmdB family regulatory protein
LPTYEYRCVSCEHQFERFQRMSDDPVQECEVCGSSVKRLLFPVAIHFKGSGFYSTDYARKNALGSAGSSAGNGGSSEGASAGDGGGSKDEASSKDGAKAAESKESSSTVAASAGKND